MAEMGACAWLKWGYRHGRSECIGMAEIGGIGMAEVSVLAWLKWRV